MPTSKLSISLPETLVSFIEEKVRFAGYGSVSEYFRELVRRDKRETAERVLQLESSGRTLRPEPYGGRPDIRRGFGDPTRLR